jgi:hypothetical protein
MKSLAPWVYRDESICTKAGDILAGADEDVDKLVSRDLCKDTGSHAHQTNNGYTHLHESSHHSCEACLNCL